MDWRTRIVEFIRRLRGTSARGARQDLQRWFETTGGRVVIGTGVAVALGVLLLGVVRLMRSNDPITPDVRYMHVETKAMLWRPVGTRPPEGYHPVEYCFQNACGPAGGTPVILNGHLGIEGPTKCPVCGATVVGRNPRPEGYEQAVPKDWGR